MGHEDHIHQHVHSHDHSHLVEAGSIGRALVIGIVLNVAYAAAEFGVGLWQGSMGLIADAGHNLSDVAGLLLALVAVKLVQKHATSQYTFGYKKASVLISLVNAVILLAAVVGIVWESVRKFFNPEQVEGWTVAVTAAVGVVVNFISARLLMGGKEHDLNVKGAYLHMILDALVSIGVVVSGVVISLTGWSFIDPIIGIVVAAVIVYSSWNLLTASLRLAVDGVPDGIDMDRLIHDMESVEGVSEVHHVHVWALSTTETAITAHIVVDDMSRSDAVRAAERRLLGRSGISHATLEVETHRGDACGECC